MPIQFPEKHPFHVARTQASLPGGSFIRALPFVVDATQRFRMDALVVCADIVAAAYTQLIELALRSKWQESQSDELRAHHIDIAMFQHAWSMVDQIYSLRLLLRSLGFVGEDVDAFMTATEPAYILRNRMDHLNALIPNIVASKSQTRALFGSLSYFVLGAAVGSPEVAVFLAVQQAEPVRPGEQVAAARIPAEMRMPIGNFMLHADSQELDLDAAILTLGPLMTRTNEGFEKSIKAQVAEKSTEHGIEESKLLAHYGARYKMMLALQPGRPAAEPESAEVAEAAPPTP
jgi:hypothetical protein